MSEEVIVVLGKRGFGKTVWVKKRIKPEPRYFSFDPMKDIPAFYCNSSYLISKHDEGELKNYKSFKFGINDISDIPVLVSLSYISGNCILVIDECSIAFEGGPSARLDPWWKEVIFMGRHRKVSLIVTAQRAVSVPIAIRSQASRVISFSQHEGSDVDWLKGYFGRRIFEIPELNKLECLDSHEGEISRYSITYD